MLNVIEDAYKKPGIMKKQLNIKLVYLFLWMLIFIIPVCFIVYGNIGNVGSFRGMAHMFMFIWSLIVVFFFNYTFLVDQYLYSERTKYVLFNIILVSLLALIMFAWEKMEFDSMSGFFEIGDRGPRHGHFYPPRIDGESDMFRPIPPFRHNIPLFITGKVLPLMLMIGMAIAIKAIYRLNKAEREVKELERSRTEAELKNLRNQLNPHFLFNTLNNIYALIDISPDKARMSILQLSDMMRHVLYEDNKSRYIQLSKELRFIEDYVSLMRLRMNDNLSINVDFPKNVEGVMVAPLMFISLVENAFKHGVSATSPSFLSIEIKLNQQGIICKVENSYFPKGKDDNSGSGVGILNLRKRLDLIYGSDYVYTTEHDDKKYVAKLILPIKRMEEQ